MRSLHIQSSPFPRTSVEVQVYHVHRIALTLRAGRAEAVVRKYPKKFAASFDLHLTNTTNRLTLQHFTYTDKTVLSEESVFTNFICLSLARGDFEI